MVSTSYVPVLFAVLDSDKGNKKAEDLVAHTIFGAFCFFHFFTCLAAMEFRHRVCHVYYDLSGL